MALLVAALLAAAPVLELKDANGTAHRLADYRGQVVLVNFWATWCEPCLTELPTLERVRAAFAGRPFAVLAVQMEGSARMSRDRAEKLSLRFPMLVDRDSAVSKAWDVKLLPTSFLIGPDGAVAYKHEGELDWSDARSRQLIEKLLPR